MAGENTYIHLIAGGVGGTSGAVLTCPLEVVKTRLQSSVAHFNGNTPPPPPPPSSAFVPKAVQPCVQANPLSTANFVTYTGGVTATPTVTTATPKPRTTTVGLYTCLKHIVHHEGPRGLFKGLGPNLIGVAPSRAIYFCAYAQAKAMCNELLPPDTPIVHICSAAAAGFTASTLTNPIWYLKTRLQLDQKRGSGSLTVRHCIQQTYSTLGVAGFYKGITASYYGISETVIHFVIYEGIKLRLAQMKGYRHDDDRGLGDFVEYMMAGATSKTIATCIAYPHEVARTRLREEGYRYRGFWQTLRTVYLEEGTRGLYRGLTTQLIRQIPNTAIMMSTYEAVVYLATHKSYSDD